MVIYDIMISRKEESLSFLKITTSIGRQTQQQLLRIAGIGK